MYSTNLIWLKMMIFNLNTNVWMAPDRIWRQTTGNQTQPTTWLKSMAATNNLINISELKSFFIPWFVLYKRKSSILFNGIETWSNQRVKGNSIEIHFRINLVQHGNNSKQNNNNKLGKLLPKLTVQDNVIRAAIK